MTNIKAPFHSICRVLFLSAACLFGHAQSTLRLNIALTNGTDAAVTWNSKSVVPLPGIKIIPDFQAEISPDFITWKAYGSSFRGQSLPLGKLGVVLTNFFIQPAQFLRIASSISLQGADLISQSLDNGDLTAAEMAGVDLFNSTLRNATFDRANLEAADLRFCDLTRASFVGANLRGVRLTSAQVQSSNFTNAILSYADLSGSDLFGSDFSNVDARFSNFSDAQMEFTAMRHMRIDTNTILPPKWRLVWRLQNEGGFEMDLHGADFSFAFLEFADLRNSLCTNADFSGADLQSANLVGADFTGADLRFVDLRDSLLDVTTRVDAKTRLVWEILNEPAENRQLVAVDLSSTSLVQAKLANANLARANFRLATCFFTLFDGAVLTNADLSGADLSASSFKNANLRGANLSGTTLEGATFLGANITNAIFSGATFLNTTMPDGSIRNR
jgi:uncharacterized protein YjbI with pentapeptide repeats